jgi:cytochrome c oxidase cbb3-type subunit 4
MLAFDGPIVIVVMLILFIGILFWAFRPKNRKRFQKDAEIPFHEDESSDGRPPR